MNSLETMRSRLGAIPGLSIQDNTPLSEHTRFGIGGPAKIYAESGDVEAFVRALKEVQGSGREFAVIGEGTNLIVSDQGFDGPVLRFTAKDIAWDGTRVYVEAGASLQDLVDFSIDRGLKGIETMTGIPGSVGAAIYGNAGAYGHSISERIAEVRFYDGERLGTFNQADCQFQYRESIFKNHKNWIIFSAYLALHSSEGKELRKIADGILTIRNRKYPPSMKCAGSIFKNLIFDELEDRVRERVPPEAIREGKVPSAFFLEQVGAKGMNRGDIHVADYHANLLYNAGQGTASQIRTIIDELKRRVEREFGLILEEEVQYVGFNGRKAR